MSRKKTVKDTDLCASGLTDPLERKVMATAMKQGEDQINIIKQVRSQESEDTEPIENSEVDE